MRTKELPNQPGYYWFFPSKGEPFLLRVSRYPSEQWLVERFGRIGEEELRRFDYGEWEGPLTVPTP